MLPVLHRVVLRYLRSKGEVVSKLKNRPLARLLRISYISMSHTPAQHMTVAPPFGPADTQPEQTPTGNMECIRASTEVFHSRAMVLSNGFYRNDVYRAALQTPRPF